MEQKLNKYFETWSPQTECIVVGSSPSLTWYEFGNHIDKFKNVIRTNCCFSPTHYPNTGKKLDIWATTTNTRWGLFNPVDSTTKEVWTRNDSVIQDLKNNGTIEVFQERNFSGPIKIMGNRDSLNFPLPGLGTGLITINEAISKYGKITIIGHTFYLEDTKYALNFNSNGKEDDEHRDNRKSYFNNDSHGITQIQYVFEWIKEGKIILLNQYEYDNLRISTKGHF